MKPCVVTLGKQAEKQLKRLPTYIKEALLAWALAVEDEGIRKARKLPGYHDEPLSGDRKGQRSIRLSRAYRAFYIEDERLKEITILVIEVNRHDY